MNDSHIQLKFLFAWAVVVAVYFLLRWNAIDIPLNRDEGGFAYLGRMIVQGGTLYVDGVDLKPPGIFFIYAAMYALGIPFTAAGVHWTFHIYNFGTLIILALLARTLFKGHSALWTALVFAVISSSRRVDGFSASTEMFLLLPIVGGFLLAALSLKAQRAAYLLYFSGFLSAAAFWIKQPSAAIAIFIAAFIVYDSRSTTASEMEGHLGSRRWVGRLAWFFLGFLSLCAIVMLYFARLGAWNEFLFWSFRLPMEYSSEFSAEVYFRTLRDQVGGLCRENPTLWLGSVAVCLWMLWRKRGEGIVVTGFLASSMVAAMHSSRMYDHYFAVVCPAVALAMGLGLDRLSALTARRRPLKFAFVGAAFLFMAVVPVALDFDYYVTNSPTLNSRRIFGPDPFPESPLVAQYLRQNTVSNDHLLILGSEPQIPVLADRPSATRHIFMYPVVGPYRKASELQAELIQDVHRTRPKFAVLVSRSTSWLANPAYGGDFLKWVNETLNSQFEPVAAFVPDSKFGKLVVGSAAQQYYGGGAKGASVLIFRNRSAEGN